MLAPVSYIGEGEAARVCSRVFDCPNLGASITMSVGVPINETNFSQCMTWINGPIAPNRRGFALQKAILECVGEASSCATAAACLPFEKIAANASACSDNTSKCTDSATAVDCSSLLVSRCDTEAFFPGSACEAASGEAACVSGTCNTPGDATCDDDILATCGPAGLTRAPCAATGLTCAENGQDASCAGAGACTKVGASVCAGNVVHACDGATLSTFDCGVIGMSCIDAGTDAASCSPPGAECTPFSDTVNVCSSNKQLTGCVGGKVVTIGCPLGKCLNAANGKTAHCG
jgi:hypothetical protein